MTTASTTSFHRRRFLGSHIDEISGFVRTPAATSRPTSIPFVSGTLPVDGWEWEALLEWARPGSRESWCALVAEALALDAKSRADIERAESPDSSATVRTSAREDLQVDSVLAYRLLGETQRAVEKMVVHGRMDQAKKLTQFRRRLQATTASIGEVIGETGLAEAEAIAALSLSPTEAARAAPKEPSEASTTEVHPLHALLALEEELERREEQAELPGATTAAASIEAPGRRPRFRARAALAGILLALVVVWGAFVGLPLVTRHAPASFDMLDFRELPGVQRVVSRPPSLYVTVGSTTWEGLPDSERRLLVESVAKVIEPAGYTGAHFKNASGATVAQWFKGSGVRLVASGTPAS